MSELGQGWRSPFGGARTSKFRLAEGAPRGHGDNPERIKRIMPEFGFAAPRRELDIDDLPDTLKPVAESAQPIYERLARHKLSASKG